MSISRRLRRHNHCSVERLESRYLLATDFPVPLDFVGLDSFGAYETEASAMVASGEPGQFRINLFENQTVYATVRSPDEAPELVHARADWTHDGNVLHSIEAVQAGETLRLGPLPVAQPGMYQLDVTTLNGRSGNVEVQLFVNAIG